MKGISRKKMLRVSKSKFAHDFYLTVSSNLGITLVRALGGIAAARLLGPAGRGELAAAIAWTGILGLIAQLGLPQAITYFTAKYSEDTDDIVYSWLVLALIQSTVAIVIGCGLAYSLLSKSKPQTLNAVFLYLWVIPPMLLTTYLNTTAQGKKEFVYFGVTRFLAGSILLISSLTGFLFRWQSSIEILRLMVFLQYLLVTIALSWAFSSFINFRFTGRPKWIPPLLKYGSRSYVAGLSWIANARIDQFIMSFSISASQLGLYAVAVSYSGVLFPILGALANVLFPHIAGVRHQIAIRKIWSTLIVTLLFGIVGVVILAILAPWGIPWLFGEPFYASVPPARLLLIGSIFLGGNYVLGDGLRGLDKPGLPSIGEAIGLVVTISGLLILLPSMGIMGAAWTSLASYSTVFIILTLLMVLISSSIKKNSSI